MATQPKSKTAKSQMLNVRIDPETLDRLRAEAERDDRTLSWLALKLIRDGLDELAGKSPA